MRSADSNGVDLKANGGREACGEVAIERRFVKLARGP
jgi:hypothetical protein